jgi:ATP-dependent protease ClpP protease subunit
MSNNTAAVQFLVGVSIVAVCLVCLVGAAVDRSASTVVAGDVGQDAGEVAVPVSLVLDAGAGYAAVRIEYDGEITEGGADKAIAAIDAANAAGAKAILLEVDSGGGDVDQGFRLVKAIERSAAPVTCMVDGTAASEAFYILQSCSVRLMTRRSLLMAHEPMLVDKATTVFPRSTIEAMEARQAQVADAWTGYAGRKLKMGVASFRKKIRGRDWWIGASEALAAGAVDALVDDARGAWARFQRDGQVE